jgi:zinc protease
MQITFQRAFKRCLGAGLALAALVIAALPARAELKVSTFTLANGMQVVVIPDHRVPVVTHMVWYRCGAADDPWGTSGIAHFLEHLMFKSTGKIKSGEFSQIITKLGGRDNAATTHDTTSYFQRVAKEHLRTVMGLEADRMVNLRLLEEEVKTERNVILEERRSSVDGNPLSLLSEQMLASLYQNHPYHRPQLGWEHEMKELSLKDAAAFYKRFYAPNNAVLVVAGDVTPEEVRPLAEASYGRNKANKAIGRAPRIQEPPAIAARRVRLEDARAGAPLLLRYYLAPTYTSGKPGEAESLELLSWIVGGDDTSRMYRRLVDTNVAATAGTNYESTILDRGRFAAVILPIPGGSMEKAEAELDAIIAEVRQNGVTQDELDKAKSALEAQRVFDLDNQSTLANRYGLAIALGRTVADIEALPARMQAITLDDIKRAAAAYLTPQLSVTGVLVPPPAPPPPPQAPSPNAAKK